MTIVGWFWVALSMLGALVLSALVWLGGAAGLDRRCRSRSRASSRAS